MILYLLVLAHLFLDHFSPASLCWSNHVSIIIGHKSEGYLVAKSRAPLSTTTTLTRFIKRSEENAMAYVD